LPPIGVSMSKGSRERGSSLISGIARGTPTATANLSLPHSKTAAELRAQRSERRIVNGARWLLLKNRDNLREGKDAQLRELLASNRSLFIVYLLRDALKDLWSYQHAGYAARAWKSWYRKALRSRIAPLRRFARNLKPYLPGILAHCRYPLGTGSSNA
jgi:transposase